MESTSVNMTVEPAEPVQNVREAIPPYRVFWPTTWMVVGMILAKWATVRGTTEFQNARGLKYLTHVLAVGYQDVIWGLLLGSVGAFLLWITRKTVRANRGAWRAWLGLVGVSVVYAIASVFIFQVMRGPLTYSLLYMAGDMAEMGSSIGAYVNLGRIALLVGLPLAALWAGVACNRLLIPERPRARRMMLAGGVLLAFTCAAYGRYLATSHPWDTSDDRRVIDSPHWALVGSYLNELAGRGGIRLDEEFPADYLDDFRTVGERGESAPTTQPVHRPKNVILLVLESVGTRYLNVYGSKHLAMPRLQEELPNCIVFDNAYSHIQHTANALVALNLSIYPGISWKAVSQEHPRISGTTLAQHLKGRGYRTMYVSSADNAFMNMGAFLADRGYDVIYDATNIPNGKHLNSWGVEDKLVIDEMIRFVEQDKSRPFFLMGWTIQNHHPYELSPGQKEELFFSEEARWVHYDLNRYLNVLAEVDRQIARLFEYLRASGLADDTVVVITGDHGESFGEPHNTWVHAGKVYQEDLAVPMIFWNPKLEKRGQRSATLAGHIDVIPTVCDLLGVELSPSWQGASMFDPARPPRVYLYGPTEHLLGVRQGDWKYIYNSTRGDEELYDLASDRDEQRNRVKERPDHAREMRKRLAAWVEFEQGHMKKLQGR